LYSMTGPITFDLTVPTTTSTTCKCWCCPNSGYFKIFRFRQCRANSSIGPGWLH
jgi:hypothetical protein